MSSGERRIHTKIVIGGVILLIVALLWVFAFAHAGP